MSARASRLRLPFRGIRVAAALALGAVLVWLGLRNADLGEVWDGVRQAEWSWLAPAVALLAVATAIRAVRWQLLFDPGRRPPLAPVSSALVIGLFFNVVLPLRAGEAARVVALHRRTRTSRAQIAATAVIERIYDVAGLLLLLFVALPWLPDVAWLEAAGWLALGLGVVLVVGVTALAVRATALVRLVLLPLRLLPVSAERRAAVNANLTQGLAGLRDLRVAVPVAVLTLGSWLVLAASFWLVTFALGLDLPFQAGILVLVATGLAMIVPSPPAALGVFEAAAVAALAAYGFSLAEALPYALVLHAVNVVPYLAAGAVLLPLEARRPAQS